MGHTVERDEALQWVEITTSTQQQITMEPTKIEISTTEGLLKQSE
ncbi:MAG TPA: hypothetical protein VF783_11530 [Terriglobales bacterium]